MCDQKQKWAQNCLVEFHLKLQPMMNLLHQLLLGIFCQSEFIYFVTLHWKYMLTWKCISRTAALQLH